ncbi:hypothetical protein GDO86_015322 [Hymenochirus boettgeri]|uniref:Protein ZIP4 homolog n=1 Tax=Hymenochirus boettgeri TaxID=247094 RepID=A0A8T2JXF3_9PIPI|nr:hypothetical protein GDO86_015322 [Hymenochirus boettgeri]
MATKTGKSWIDVSKPDLAKEFLEIAVKSLEKLYVMLTQRSTQEAVINVHKILVEKDLFKVLTYQAEVAVAQKDFETASVRIQRCKDMLIRQPKEAVYLSILCYNFGVETYKKKFYEESSFWLSQSYEIGKREEMYNTGKEMQAKVLRLLATVYMEWNCRLYQDKAIDAIDMANKESLHPFGVFLKMKILLDCCVDDEVLNKTVVEMLNHDVSQDTCLTTVKLLLDHKRYPVGFNFLKMICKKFESSPDLEKALILYVEVLLLQGKDLLAQQKIEDIITNHYTKKQLSPEMQRRIHIIFWDCAAKCFEAKNYTESIQWYNYSLRFYSTGNTEKNFAKLQRNRAMCYIHLKQYPKAREAIKEAECCDPGCIYSQFILFKIEILEDNILEATNAISAMGRKAVEAKTENLLMEQFCSPTDLLSLAAQIALENGRQEVAIKALEILAEQSQDKEQVFTSLRCLIRLLLAREETESGDKRSGLLTEHQGEGLLSKERCIAEANWFRKIAWNLAVKTQESPQMMREFFTMSYKFSLFCPSDKPVLAAQKSCLLLAAAVDLEMARKTTDHNEKVKFLTQSLENIHLCREIWNVLQSCGELSNDPTEILLLLYEFEVRAKLNDPLLNSVLDEIWELPDLEIKTLETIASLSMEAPAYYPSICKQALNGALSLIRKQDPLDMTRISKCLHSLVKLIIPEGTVEPEPCAQEEAWRYYQEALSFITSFENYPEMETLWLMTRAWNTGVILYSVKKYSDAERWCGLAMRLLNFLGSLKSSYENKMGGLYSEILERLDNVNKA